LHNKKGWCQDFHKIAPLDPDEANKVEDEGLWQNESLMSIGFGYEQ